MRAAREYAPQGTATSSRTMPAYALLPALRKSAEDAPGNDAWIEG